MRAIFAFLLLGPASPCMAENSAIASYANQWWQGQYCSDIKRADLRGSPFSCRAGSARILNRTGGDAADVFDHLVFSEGARRQITKNRCLQEEVSALTRDPRRMAAWKSYLAAAWLGYKKSELAVRFCTGQFLNKIEPALAKRMGAAKAWDQQHAEEMRRGTFGKPFPEEMLAKWKPVCLNEGAMKAMRNARQLFAFALPVVTDAKFLDTMESYRGDLINKDTGKPLSDRELLDKDLHDLSFVKFKADGGLDGALISRLNGLARDRAGIAGQLEAANRSPDGISSDLKDYMYQDGTVAAVMADNKLDTDAGGKMSAAAACLSARFEPHLAGVAADFGVTALISGGLIGLTAKGLGFVRLATVSNSMKAGLFAANGKQAVQDLYQECLSPVRRQARTADVAAREASVTLAAADLSSDLAYERWSIDFKHEETPSCPQDSSQNLMLNSSLDAQCTMHALTLALPVSLSLPISAAAAAEN